ncbi:MAG TPA: hypothetical protein VK001_13390 [Geminicoccaceae bacterium]|nr:hypothetical protein [Geminicoccaceae bacterium]
MFGSALLRCSEHQRPFWLTVALSILLLASVSITFAHAADAHRLAHGLKRDFGALRAKLEQIDPHDAAPGERSVAFNADLGDGSAAFHRDSLVTMASAASRRLERLIGGYRADGDAARLRTAEALRLAMYDLQRQIDQLARAAEPAAAEAARAAADARLGQAERLLDILLGDAPKPPEVSAVAARAPLDGAR